MSASSLRQRRGFVRASLTKLNTRVGQLEAKAGEPGTTDLVQQAKLKLEKLDSEFKARHYDLLNELKEEAELETEQATLDSHDDEVALLSVRLEKLIATCGLKSSSSNEHKVALRKLQHLKDTLSSIIRAIDNPSLDPRDVCLLRQYEEDLGDLKREFGDVRSSLYSLEIEEGGKISILLASVRDSVFGCSLKLKKLTEKGKKLTTESDGVKLPKLEVPTFDGDILQWKSFWEQFVVSVHGRTNLSNSEKLVYLQQALKGGVAKQAIEGLSKSGDNYEEAVKCLQERYDRPRFIHQTHVKRILETPPLRDGSGRELRRLHDVVLQHLRALKSMEYDPSGPFVTSMLELKLDSATMFEWQKHTQTFTEVPHYQELLEFIDLRARASEASADSGKKSGGGNKKFTGGQRVASFAGTADTTPTCVFCKSGKHPLYMCIKFKNLPHDKMLSTLKANDLCINCLKPGHFVRECKSSHRCRKCQKSHHTLLHLEPKNAPDAIQDKDSASAPALPPQSDPVVISHAAVGIKSDLLMMTCLVVVESPSKSSVTARALLDSASSVSFISERFGTESGSVPNQSECSHYRSCWSMS